MQHLYHMHRLLIDGIGYAVNLQMVSPSLAETLTRLIASLDFIPILCRNFLFLPSVLGEPSGKLACSFGSMIDDM